MDKLVRLLGVVAVALIIWYLPHTPEISDQGWHLLGSLSNVGATHVKAFSASYGNS